MVINKYIEYLKGSASANKAKELAKKAKKKKKQDVMTLEMKLKQSVQQRPNSAYTGGKRKEELKFGMNSINLSGVQQNTSCMFDYQLIEDEEPKVEEPIETLIPCRNHSGYMKPDLDQKNPYKTLKCEKPLCNLSPYLKESRNISDEEEKKIIEYIEIFKRKVRNWDNEEDEKLRRFLEIQDPEFREKLLACMKEHIQETNLIKSFFIRYKDINLPKRSKSLCNTRQRGKRVNFKKERTDKRERGFDPDDKENRKLNQTMNTSAYNTNGFESKKNRDKSAIIKNTKSDREFDKSSYEKQRTCKCKKEVKIADDYK